MLRSLIFLSVTGLIAFFVCDDTRAAPAQFAGSIDILGITLGQVWVFPNCKTPSGDDDGVICAPVPFGQPEAGKTSMQQLNIPEAQRPQFMRPPTIDVTVIDMRIEQISIGIFGAQRRQALSQLVAKFGNPRTRSTLRLQNGSRAPLSTPTAKWMLSMDQEIEFLGLISLRGAIGGVGSIEASTQKYRDMQRKEQESGPKL